MIWKIKKEYFTTTTNEFGSNIRLYVKKLKILNKLSIYNCK